MGWVMMSERELSRIDVLSQVTHGAPHTPAISHGSRCDSDGSTRMTLPSLFGEPE